MIDYGDLLVGSMLASPVLAAVVSQSAYAESNRRWLYCARAHYLDVLPMVFFWLRNDPIGVWIERCLIAGHSVLLLFLCRGEAKGLGLASLMFFLFLAHVFVLSNPP